MTIHQYISEFLRYVPQVTKVTNDNENMFYCVLSQGLVNYTFERDLIHEALFMNYVYELEPNFPKDIPYFVLACFHECGHLVLKVGASEFDRAVLSIQYPNQIQLEKIYMRLPEETNPTIWAIENIINNLGSIREFSKTISSYL